MWVVGGSFSLFCVVPHPFRFLCSPLCVPLCVVAYWDFLRLSFNNRPLLFGASLEAPHARLEGLSQAEGLGDGRRRRLAAGFRP